MFYGSGIDIKCTAIPMLLRVSLGNSLQERMIDSSCDRSYNSGFLLLQREMKLNLGSKQGMCNALNHTLNIL